MFNRKQVAVLGAEFLGTGVLALVMLSVQHSTIGLPYFVAIAAGAAVAGLMLTFTGNGGGYFNPAITIGLWTVRQLHTLRAIAYIIAEMLGAWAAYYVYTYFVKTTLQPIGGTYDARILVAEAVGALLLSMAFAAAVFSGFSATKKAGTVGVAYALAIIVSASAAVGIVNPAVALSMRAFDVFGSMGWLTYALGPIAGAVLGFNLYALLFADASNYANMRAAVAQRISRPRTATASAKPVAAAEPARSSSKAAPKRATRSTSRARKSRTTRTTRARR